MAINIGNALLNLGANTAQLQSDLGKANQTLDSFKRVATTVLAGIGAGISIAGVTAVIKGAINAADSLAELQKRTGVAANELLVLQGAAQRSGVGMEAVGDVASKLSKRMAEAQHGTGDAATAFRAMGISVTDAGGNLKNVDQILGEVGKKFSGYEDGANKAALATAALGKGGDSLIPMLETIEETRKRFEDLGITISQDTLEAANKFNDTMDDTKDVLGVMAQQIAAALLPTLQNIADMFVNAAKDSETFKIAISGLEVVIKSVTSVAIGLGTVISGLGVRIGALVDASKLLGEGRFADAWAAIKKGAEDAERVMLAGGRAIKTVWDDAAKSVARVAPRVSRVQAPRLPSTSTARAGGANKDAFAELLAKNALRRLKMIEEAEEAGIRAAEEYQRTLDGLISNTALARTQKMQESADFLRKAFEDGRIPVEQYKEAMNQLLGVVDEAAERAKAIGEMADRLISETPIERAKEMQAVIDELNRRMREGELAASQYEAAIAILLDTANKKAQETNDVMRELGITFTSAFEDAIAGGKSFSDILKGIEKDLLRLGTRKLVTEPFAKWFDDAIKPSGGGAGGFNFGGIMDSITGAFSSIFGGGRASGGMVSAGRAYVVGEDGPELLVPNMSGRVIPNGAMGAVNLTMVVNTPDANSFRASRNQIAGEMQSALAASRRNR